METMPEMSKQEKDVLDGLRGLVNYTTEHLKPVDMTKITLKQNLLMAMFAPINQYTEAICELCTSRRPSPANVILRSIVEAWINSLYVLGHPNDKAGYLFAIEDSYYRRGFATEALAFYSRYPKQMFLPPDFLNDLLEKTEDELKEYKDKKGIYFENKGEFNKKWGSLLSRAQWVDTRNKKRQGDKAGGVENTYLVAYKYLSEYTHLSMRGLEHFIKRDENGESYLIDKNPDGADAVLATTYTIYLHFAQKLKQYGIVDCSFSEYFKFFRETVKFTVSKKS